ncbi:MAG: GNAT family N-acetyltransferase [Candidatus Heimdallarchaeota archaeon]|nr:GNAT family N-acetyltransferase [Candidatus Heimdallarchaeota archaeon]
MDILFEESDHFKQIKDLEISDAKLLADCLNTWGDDESWGGSFGSTEFTEKRIIDEWIKDNNARQRVVKYGDEIQAYCSYDGHWTDKDTAYIPLLGARPKEQKKGYGKALLLDALMQAVNEGRKRLNLGTWAGNIRAVPLYKKIGFMWAYETSVQMENYLPAILNTELFRPFFTQFNFYTTRQFEMLQEHDDYQHHGMQGYYYYFVGDEQNSLKVFIDHWAKEMTGFAYKRDGKCLEINFHHSSHEIFLGIDTGIDAGIEAVTELHIKNEWEEDIQLNGINIPFKYLSMDDNIQEYVATGEQKIISIHAKIDKSCTTINPDLQKYARVDTRFFIEFNINDSRCDLGTGWVTKKAVSLKLNNPGLLYLNSQSQVLDCIFSNFTENQISGYLKIECSDAPNDQFPIHIDPKSKTNIRLDIPSPQTSTLTSWDFILSVNDRQLPVITKHIAQFKPVGAVAYTNPQAETIIENEYLRCYFSRYTGCGMYRIETQQGISAYFNMFRLKIGKPFPETQSEFWGDEERHYEVINEDNLVRLKLTITSDKEKPGLEVTRWVELSAGSKSLCVYYELHNTTNEQINDIAIRYQDYLSLGYPLHGTLVIPSKEGLLRLDDRSFGDSKDNPHKPEDFEENWFAVEPYNALGIGYGLIWDDDMEKISVPPFGGHPTIQSKTIDLNAGERRQIARAYLVIDTSAAKETRNLWKKLTGNTTKIEQTGIQLLEVSFGEELDRKLKMGWVDTASPTQPLSIHYQGLRENKLDMNLSVNRKTEQISLEAREQANLQFEYQSEEIGLLPYNSKVDNIERFESYLMIPFDSRSLANIMKEGHSWIVDNGFFSFSVDPSHNGLIHSLRKDEEMLFTKYPSKDPYTFYRVFLGGIHPIVHSESNKKPHELEEWTTPTQIDQEGWIGLEMRIENSICSDTLKHFEFVLRYKTRPGSPLLLCELEGTNKSSMPLPLTLLFVHFFRPIKSLSIKFGDEMLKFNEKHGRERFSTIQPYNWAYIEADTNFIIRSGDARAVLSSNYVTADVFCHIRSGLTDELQPGDTLLHRSYIMLDAELLSYLPQQPTVGL